MMTERQMNMEVMNDYRVVLSEKHLNDTRIRHLKDDLEARQNFITPTGEAWKLSGTSEDDRKHALQKLFLEDAVCQEIKVSIRALEITQARIEATIDEIEAVRRNDEGITSRLLGEALHAKYVSPILIEQVEATTEAVGEAACDVTITDLGPVYTGDDIPF
jgi:GTPase